MTAISVLLVGPDGAGRLQPPAGDLRTAVDEAIAARGPDGAVVLHDSTVDADVLARGLAVLRDTGCAAVVAAAQQTDTLKLATASRMIARTIDRSRTYELRTPQIYRAAGLRAALARTAPDVVERAVRDGDHAFLPGLIEGTVRILPLPPDQARETPDSSASARPRSTG